MKDKDFGSYADDKTPYTKGDILDDVTKTLESDSVRLFQLFKDNQMNAYKDKCHLLVSGRYYKTINVCNTGIMSSDSLKN